MSQFPHSYSVKASANPKDNVELAADGLPTLHSAPPTEFGGPGDQWSPEDLIVAAVADCFVLSFRAIAAASKLEFTDIQCSVSGTLDKVERVTRFTQFQITADLKLPAGADKDRAQRSLEKAENMCFITNSLVGEVHLVTNISEA